MLTYCFRNKEKTRPFRDFEEEWVDLGKQFYLNVFEPGYIYLTLNDSVKFTKIKLQTFLIGDIQCNTSFKRVAIIFLITCIRKHQFLLYI